MCEYICLLLELPSCVLNFRSVILLVWCCGSLTSSFCLTHLCVLWLLRHHHSFKPRVRAGLLLILCRLWWHLAVVVPAVAENMKKKGRHQCLKKKKIKPSNCVCSKTLSHKFILKKNLDKKLLSFQMNLFLPCLNSSTRAEEKEIIHRKTENMLPLLQEFSNYLSEPKVCFSQHLRNVSVSFSCELCTALIFYV